MEARAKVIRGPHRLYTGANGVKTYGVTLASLRDVSGVPEHLQAFQKQWDENDFTVARWKPEDIAPQLGMTPDQLRSLQAEVTTMCKDQRD